MLIFYELWCEMNLNHPTPSLDLCLILIEGTMQVTCRNSSENWMNSRFCFPSNVKLPYQWTLPPQSLCPRKLLHQKLLHRLYRHLQSSSLVVILLSNLLSKACSRLQNHASSFLDNAKTGTTIATTVLHGSRVTATYPTKHLVSSELVPTIELLEARCRGFLHPQNEQRADLVSWIVGCIHSEDHSVLLYIETVWEVESAQPKVDSFFEILSAMGSRLAVLVTMRGSQAPTNVVSVGFHRSLCA
ncbi:hypothetical protein DL96DRAFT_418246 [Flagelloscypha sp. PMI_526]|nr:hypothetical protein DL96DRAFT_418246 [Flagelloscypha sp. PMI_526]